MCDTAFTAETRRQGDKELGFGCAGVLHCMDRVSLVAWRGWRVDGWYSVRLLVMLLLGWMQSAECVLCGLRWRVGVDDGKSRDRLF